VQGVLRHGLSESTLSATACKRGELQKGLTASLARPKIQQLGETDSWQIMFMYHSWLGLCMNAQGGQKNAIYRGVVQQIYSYNQGQKSQLSYKSEYTALQHSEHVCTDSKNT